MAQRTEMLRSPAERPLFPQPSLPLIYLPQKWLLCSQSRTAEATALSLGACTEQRGSFQRTVREWGLPGHTAHCRVEWQMRKPLCLLLPPACHHCPPPPPRHPADSYASLAALERGSLYIVQAVLKLTVLPLWLPSARIMAKYHHTQLALLLIT